MGEARLKEVFRGSYLFLGVLRDRVMTRKYKNAYCYFDTGARVCTMPLSWWKDLGFAEHLLVTRPELFEKRHGRLPFVKDLVLSGDGPKVPFELGEVQIASGETVPAFKFVMDILDFGNVKYPNVLFNVVDTSFDFPIIGRNVLVPSEHHWIPNLEGDTDGELKLKFGKEHLPLYLSKNPAKEKYEYVTGESDDFMLLDVSEFFAESKLFTHVPKMNII